MPTTIVKDMPNTSSEIRVNWDAGLEEGQLFLVGARNGSKICTLMQLSQDPRNQGATVFRLLGRAFAEPAAGELE